MTPRIGGVLFGVTILVIGRVFGETIAATVLAIVVALLPALTIRQTGGRWSWRQCALAGIFAYVGLAIFLLVSDRTVYTNNPLLWAVVAAGTLTWLAAILRLRAIGNRDRDLGTSAA